jgi:hypothetical protein
MIVTEAPGGESPGITVWRSIPRQPERRWGLWKDAA